MKKIIFVIFFVCLLFGSTASVVAFMPVTHKFIFQKAMQDPIDSEIYKACAKYPSLCYSGNVLTDISVIWYWLEGEKYVVTHSPNFCRALIGSSKNDEEYACAIGGCTHQPADIPSHNFMVPYAIEHSFLANTIIHVFAEQKVANWVEKNYPGTKAEALNYLGDYEKCMPLFKRVMLGSEGYGDVTEEEINEKFDKFVTEIMTSQTGYDTAFKQKSFMVNFKAIPISIMIGYVVLMGFWLLMVLLLVLKIVKRESKVRHYIAIIIFLGLFLIFGYIFMANIQGKAFSAVISIAKPISYFVPLGDSPQYYVNLGIQNTKQLLLQGPQWLTNTEASGFTALDKADRGILLWDYIIIIILLVLLILYVWYLFRKNKIKPTQTFSMNM